MAIIVKETKLEQINDFFQEYLATEHNITDKEKINQISSDIKEKLEKGERTLFVAFRNKEPIGFISGKIEDNIFETTGFYIKEKNNIENCGFLLITTLVRRVFELGIDFYRHSINLPANFEPSFESSLREEGFYVYPRVGMLKELNKNEELTITLPENYSFESFSLNRIDELFQLMKEANPPEHTDSHIYPEMLDPAKSKKIFSDFSDGFKKINADINPQIIFDNKLVGLSFVLEQKPEIVFVAEVCISPQHQRKGLGKALMNKIISECATKGYKKLGLAVTVENSGAYKLYEKLGFKVQNNFLSISKPNK